LGSPAGIADIDLHIPDPDASLARPARFD
jgi:hypothetical protein